MPTSDYRQIGDFLQVLFEYRDEIASVLDIGVGFGKYGVLTREYLDVWSGNLRRGQWQVTIDGIEAYRGYKNPIYSYAYNEVFTDQAESVVPSLGVYDIVVFVDVIEHLEKEDGFRLLNQLLSRTVRFIYVCHPDGEQESALDQGHAFGNRFEQHRARWTHEDFTRFPYAYSISNTQTFLCTNESDLRRIRTIRGLTTGATAVELLPFQLSVLTGVPEQQPVKETGNPGVESLTRKQRSTAGGLSSTVRRVVKELRTRAHPVRDRLPRSVLRRMHRPMTGPRQLESSLRRGLSQRGLKVQWNSIGKQTDTVVHVLRSVEALEWALEKKRAGEIKYLVVGPNVVPLPHSHDYLIVDEGVDLILVASPWIKDWFLEDAPALDGRIAVWPVGIDLRQWCPAPNKVRKYDFLIVDKMQAEFWSHTIDEDLKNIRTVLTNELTKMGLSYRTLTYGSYTQAEYLDRLVEARAMLYLSPQETQGIALMEAWSCNVPTLVLDPQVAGHREHRFNRASSCPYLSPSTGMRFLGQGDFGPVLSEFVRKLKDGAFAPRQYVAPRFSIRASTEHYLTLLRNSVGHDECIM